MQDFTRFLTVVILLAGVVGGIILAIIAPPQINFPLIGKTQLGYWHPSNFGGFLRLVGFSLAALIGALGLGAGGVWIGGFIHSQEQGEWSIGIVMAALLLGGGGGLLALAVGGFVRLVVSLTGLVF
jgi:hypothetical protein